MDPLESQRERERKLRRDARRADKERRDAEKDLRKMLVRPDRDMRPIVLSRGLKRFFLWRAKRGPGALDTEARSRAAEQAKHVVEQVLAGVLLSAWILLTGLVIVDAIRANRPDDVTAREPESIVFEYGSVGLPLLVIGVVALILIVTDLYTYRPRIFSLSAAAPERFFRDMAGLEASIHDQLKAIDEGKPSTWSDAKELQERLIEESTQFLVLRSMRLRIMRRVLERLGGLIAALALIGYASSAVSGGSLLAKTQDGTGMAEHLYFALATFFTMGFGDVFPQHNALGYGYVALIAMTFAAVVYFVLSEVIASQGEFRTNVRTAAETYVMQHSTL